MQVYAKLAHIKAWNEWHKSTWVLRAPGQEQLMVGDKFSYTAPFVLGNVQAEVQDAAQSKVGKTMLAYSGMPAGATMAPLLSMQQESHAGCMVGMQIWC